MKTGMRNISVRLLTAVIALSGLLLAMPAPARAISAELAGAAYLAEHTGDLPYYTDGSEFVFITPDGARYHCKDNCTGIETAFLVSIEEACRLGYTACGRCHPTPMIDVGWTPDFPAEEPLVYIVVQDPFYHKAKHVKKKKLASEVTLEEAEYLGRTPCEECFPSGAPK
ncbi:MAG TPA: hypothetical protein PLP25_00950 [Candidatus Limiplasma sp.]|nr:hypothetical protein [Candidatus Limiplasma sp.]HPS80411.1 hypothetical protein [Candidatus Limiplasma sp.]